MATTYPPDSIYGDMGLNVGKAHKLTIEFYSVLLGKSVEFLAMLTDYSDKYETSWESEAVYGRMDEIQTYSGTKRSISLGWEIVSAHTEEAKTNFNNCTDLFSMLYPTYDSGAEQGGGGGASGLRGAPLFKVKFTNLIQDASAAPSPGASAEAAGLLCTVSGFTFEPDLDAGMFVADVGVLYPKFLKLSCDLNILHTHAMGFSGADGSARSGFDKFPYGERSEASDSAAASEFATGGAASSDAGSTASAQADAADMEGG